MIYKKLFFLFICLLIFTSSGFAITNSNSTNKQKTVSEETLKFWESTLKYGTSAQKKSVLSAIQGNNIKEAANIIVNQLPEEKNLVVKKSMISTLVAISNQTVRPYILNMIKKSNLNEDMEEFILNAISLTKFKETGKYLLKYLDSKSITIKESALRAIAAVEYTEAVPLIINKLKEEKSDRIKTEMILTLAELKSEKAQTTLISIFTNNNEKSINRGFAATGLGYIKNELSYKILREYYEKVDTQIKLRIIDSLGNLDNKQSIDLLIDCLTDDDKNIRYYAAQSLGKLKAKEAVEILKYKKDYDLETNVRTAADKALETIVGVTNDKK